MAPIREDEDAFAAAWDEDEGAAAAAAADPWREFKSARGARGGALPDIGEHDEMDGGGREGNRRVVVRWWSWVKRHRPQLRALVDILGHLNFVCNSFGNCSLVSLVEYAHISVRRRQ